MQPRFECLVLDVEDCTRFFRRQPLDIAQHHGRAVYRRQGENRSMQPLAKLRFEQMLVCQLRPVCRLVFQFCVRLVSLACRRQPLFFLRTLIGARPEPRHRRVERNAEDPGRQRRVASKLADFAMNFEQNVLRDLFRIFFIAEIPERELVDTRAVRVREIRKGLLVASLKTREKCVVCGSYGVSLVDVMKNTRLQ